MYNGKILFRILLENVITIILYITIKNYKMAALDNDIAEVGKVGRKLFTKNNIIFTCQMIVISLIYNHCNHVMRILSTKKNMDKSTFNIF